MSLRVASHFLCGTAIWIPFKTIPSSTVSSSLMVHYGCTLLGTSLVVLGHPCVIVCLSSTSSSSSYMAILISSKLSLLALSWFEIWCTCSLGSLIVSFCPPSWDKQSANWLVLPEMYFTVKWYANVLISIVCNHGVTWLQILDNMASDISELLQAENDWHKESDGTSSLPKATASDSDSIAT